MTPRDIWLIRSTFDTLAPHAEQVAAAFYSRLFALDPSLRALFRGDMTGQGQKLMQMLTVVVRGLDRLDTLMPALRALGYRHGGYGVQPAHYQTVGAALLMTLADGLGDDFTPEVEAAWTTAYTTLAGVMIDAANPLSRERVA